MTALANIYFAHPFWVWLAVGAVLLALEVLSGTGWLLWPAASAGVVALFTLTGINIGWPGDITLFAVLTIVSSLVGRRLMPRHVEGPNINDRTDSLPGKIGLAVAATNGRIRVMVDGAEWDAEVEGDAAPAVGDKLEVVRVLGGAKLAVRAV